MGYISERQVAANGLNFCLAEAGDPTAPMVILLHGFPECWASWRFQLPVLAESGFYAVAPDLRGYGLSDAPGEMEAYSQTRLTDDVVALIRACGHRQAVVVGHDWGAALAWQVARRYPQQVRAVVALSVPYGGPSPVPPSEAMKAAFADAFFYMLYFQQPEVPEHELEGDVRDSLRRIFHAWSAQADTAAFLQPRQGGGFLDGMPVPEIQPHWMREVDLDFYVSRFEKSGFRGPLNWYRAMDTYWWETRDEPEQAWQITCPALYMVGRQDPVLMMNSKALKRMANYVPQLQGPHILEDCGHWTQMEQPSEVNRYLLEFIEDVGRQTSDV